ncbi:peptidase U62 modulator of DNA gyrase [Methanocaldococcus villosus KIN24-T80]|uniref:Peptidase U62 modulator of DNA gyrase n=1 Tax=Methanocaldococcus villosus KIN24-T80 TaxID=1069083 RepID=N6V394_9EURY|nr:TldD/PmbA family protein [Methanocaldococcus villosus]ENN96728.1 peptidase U62 modulator of DNA gyrase [Methanocaldococcus villosus KIN24-T80]
MFIQRCGKGEILDIDKIIKLLDIGDYADVRINSGYSNSIVLKDGVFEEISFGMGKGIAVRVLYKNGWGFCKSKNIEDLEELIKKAYKMAKLANDNTKKEVILKDYKAINDKYKLIGKIAPYDVDIEEKKRIAIESYKAMRDEKIKSISVSYSDICGKKIFINSEGSFIEGEVGRAIMYMSCVAKENGRLEYASERIGGFGFENIKDNYLNKSKEAKDRALRMLKAKPCPKGEFKVILDHELAGVFIHEAVGHAAEADLVLQNDSVFKGKLNQKVGSEIVNVIDDPTLENGFGSYKYDDEGVEGKRTVIIENGILKSYLHSRETAGRLDMELTGNGRAEGLNRPIVRMSNTYIEPGDWSLDELIEDTKEGLFLKGSRGGQVDTGKGLFQFSAVEAYKIENGELKEVIKDAGLSGEILDILFKIDAITKDLKLSVGYCGKNGQSVPVGDGGGCVRTKTVIS